MRSMLFAVAMLASATASASAQSDSRWRYARTVDPISHRDEVRACIYSDNSLHLVVFADQPLELCISQHPRHGRRVIIRLPSGGQFNCSTPDLFLTTTNCVLPARIDDGRHNYAASEGLDVADGEIAITFGSGALIHRLRSATVVHIEVPIWQGGRQTATFSAAGLRWPPENLSPTSNP